LGYNVLLDVIVHINDGDGFYREEGVIVVIEHFGCELANDGFHLDAEVPYHGVAMPSPHYSDVVQVDARMEHCHGTPRLKGACANFACCDTGGMEVGHHHMT
jgi:hypothetical protein